jgi:hypothetical protein
LLACSFVCRLVFFIIPLTIATKPITITPSKQKTKQQGAEGKEAEQKPPPPPLPDKIRLGEEAPTFWLLRYGEKLSNAQTSELQQIQRDLHEMEQQMESDKNYIQLRIVAACNLNRETQEELAGALQGYSDSQQLLRVLQDQFQAALEDAEDIAADAVRITALIASER